MYGYASRILEIDLSKEESRVDVLRKEMARKYIGGLGLGIKLVYDKIESNVDALGPGNPLVLATGPTSGIMAPTGWAHVFAAKSPLTGGLGVAMAHGCFARNLKRAGYDAVTIVGKSPRATFLWIDDDSVQFVGAQNLWGQSPAETEASIREDLGDTSIGVAAVGLAGENQARIACIISDGTRVAGRSGIGAVMGSKNLKAIAIRGSKSLEVADNEGLQSFSREFFLKARGSAAIVHYKDSDASEVLAVKDRIWGTTFEPTAKYRDLGTSEDVLIHNSLGCLPTKNFGTGSFEGAEKVSGQYLNEHYVSKVQADSPCSISCEHIAVVPEGPYQDTVARVEYGSIWAFGPNCGVDRMDAIIKAIELCNIYGLDTISTGNVIGFAMDCYERGILSYEDTDGQDLRFGNYQAMLVTIRKIGTREGFGDTLAEGVRRASEKIGNGAEALANHIKGLEISGYDIRCLKTAALGFAVSFSGADHDRHWAHLYDIKGKVNRFTAEEGRGKIVKNMEDLFTVVDSLSVCKFLIGAYEGFEDLARLYNLITGFDVTEEELRLAGERINNLARLFNLREGFSRDDDSLPPKVMKVPIPDGPSKGSFISEEELNLLLDDYYNVRGWTKKGIPSEEKLKELGL